MYYYCEMMHKICVKYLTMRIFQTMGQIIFYRKWVGWCSWIDFGVVWLICDDVFKLIVHLCKMYVYPLDNIINISTVFWDQTFMYSKVLFINWDFGIISLNDCSEKCCFTRCAIVLLITNFIRQDFSSYIFRNNQSNIRFYFVKAYLLVN